MSTLVIVLRTAALLAFAGPMLLRKCGGRHGKPRTGAIQDDSGRAPVLANFVAFGFFLPSLFIFADSSGAAIALPLALTGCFLALAGVAFVRRSRAVLGPAWSLTQYCSFSH